MQITSIEDQAFRDSVPFPTAPLLEAYQGSQIVRWWSLIDNQLTSTIAKYDSSRNFADATKVRQFQRTWRDNELTGSVNREDVNALKVASAQLAVDNWKLQDYFSNLASSLRQLEASLEELPPGGEPYGAEDQGKGPSSDFGPSEQNPPPTQNQPDAVQTSGPTSQA